jgi:hypothetical protein
MCIVLYSKREGTAIYVQISYTAGLQVQLSYTEMAQEKHNFIADMQSHCAATALLNPLRV